MIDAEGRLLGVVTLEEWSWPRSPRTCAVIVAADLMRGGVTPLRPDDRLDRALELFVESDLLALPVVDGPRGAGRRHRQAGRRFQHVFASRPRRGCSRNRRSRKLTRRHDFQNGDDHVRLRPASLAESVGAIRLRKIANIMQ